MSRGKKGPALEMTGGFLLVMAWLNYISSIRFFMQALLAAVLHEGGHYIAVRVLGGTVSKIRLSAVGAQMQQEGTLSYGKEFISTAAGPAVNLIVAFAAAKVAGDEGFVFAGLNLALFVLNMLPFAELDGGRCLFLLVTWWLGPAHSVKVCGWLECALSCGLVCVGGYVLVAGGNITLLPVSIWLLCQNVRKMFASGGKKGLSFLRRTGKMIRA